MIAPVECASSDAAACSLDELSSADLDAATQHRLVLMKIDANRARGGEFTRLTALFNKTRADAIAMLRVQRAGMLRKDTMCTCNPNQKIDAIEDPEERARARMAQDSREAWRQTPAAPPRIVPSAMHDDHVVAGDAEQRARARLIQESRNAWTVGADDADEQRP